MEDSTPSLHILPPPSLAITRRKEVEEKGGDDEEGEEESGGSGNGAAAAGAGAAAAAVKERLRLLASVQGVLRRVVGLEARLWLCSALQAVAVPDGVHAPVFMDLLRRAIPPPPLSASHRSQREESGEEQAVKQALRMLCESRPRQVARLLLDDSKMLCRFFSGQTKRVLQWFQNFAIAAGEMDHQLGARALARYAFTHRETSWHELVWKGNHSQAPATVAAKPHYFAELDVQETVENFLDHVPSFWYSNELKESLEDGAFIALDVDFFVEELLDKMAMDEESRVWQLVRSYLREESFGVLCQRVLPIVGDRSLLEVVNSLAAAMAKWKKRKPIDKTERGEGRRGSLAGDTTTATGGNFWLEIVLSAGVKWKTLDDAIFCNACAGHGRGLLRLLQEENDEQDGGKLLESLLLTDRDDGYNDHDHWAVRQQCLGVQKWEAVTWLALEAWLLFYLLSREVTSPAVLERLMTENGIGFLRTGHENELEGGGGTAEADRGREEKRSRKRKRWKSKQKKSTRKRRYSKSDDDSDSDTDLPFVAEQYSGGSGVGWRLSSDDYVITWTKTDVCEYLVNYALSRWLQWTMLRW